MPIYEYRCSACSKVFETLQRVSDEPLNQCRLCGGRASRIISSPAIHFVGSGWYVTDYARKGAARKDGGPKDGATREGSRSAAGEGAKAKAEASTTANAASG